MGGRTWWRGRERGAGRRCPESPLPPTTPLDFVHCSKGGG